MTDIGSSHNISVDFLKVIASLFIVNSHFGNVWPFSQLATGGLIGDCLFFMASGYCLYGIRNHFPRWYLKRIVRVYPTVWISICVGLFIGLYRIGSISDMIAVLVYPTPFHFVGSIMICYIIYYFIVKFSKEKNISLAWMILVIFAIYLLLYIFFYDKSYYHIDVVEDNYIRFLFLEAMLVGALFKESDKFAAKVKDLSMIFKIGGILALGFIYFVTKLLFSHYESISRFQVINQVTILIFVGFLFVAILGEENSIQTFKKPIVSLISNTAAVTLEIYVFHHYFISLFDEINFPLNALLIVASTLAVAYLLHKIPEKLTEYLKKKGL